VFSTLIVTGDGEGVAEGVLVKAGVLLAVGKGVPVCGVPERKGVNAKVMVGMPCADVTVFSGVRTIKVGVDGSTVCVAVGFSVGVCVAGAVPKLQETSPKSRIPARLDIPMLEIACLPLNGLLI